MMTNRWSMIVLASVVAAPVALMSGFALAQTVGAEATAKMPTEPMPTMTPAPETLPGIRLSNKGGTDLGIVQRVVQIGGKKFALVTVGNAASKIGNGLIAVPAKDIRVDGQKLTYNISWSRYKSLPLYDGTMPTWMNKKKK